jgi:6-phosphogluconolactonase (cycloisomerase 2 family)
LDANAGSADFSGYTINSAGRLSLINGSQVAASTGGGPIDLAASNDGQYLYVESGGTGTVDEFRVNSDGPWSRSAWSRRRMASKASWPSDLVTDSLAGAVVEAAPAPAS